MSWGMIYPLLYAQLIYSLMGKKSVRNSMTRFSQHSYTSFPIPHAQYEPRSPLNQAFIIPESRKANERTLSQKDNGV